MSPNILVIGAGVNERVAAHCLARAGHRVQVLLQHPAGEEGEFQPGWVPAHVARALGLERDGGPAALTIRSPDPWIAVALPDGETLELWHDIGRSVESIRRLNPEDAKKWPAFCERMARLARLLETLYESPPPDLLSNEFGELARLAGFGLALRRGGRQTLEDLLRLTPMPVADLLDDWFVSDALKAALGAAGVAQLLRGPRSGGTAFRLLHAQVGNPPGVFRPPLSNLGRLLGQRAGVALRHEAPVARILVRESRVAGVVLRNGEELPATLVVSGADPRRTLLDWLEPGGLDPEFTRAVRHIRCRGVRTRVTLTLDGPPRFETLLIAPSLDYLERAYDDAKYGRVSHAPVLEARSIGPVSGNSHRVHVDVQYTPYTLAEGEWNDERRSALAERVIGILSDHVPRLRDAVTTYAVSTPRDLEALYGYPEGQPDHAELALDQAFWMRPVPGWAHYRTPIAGLYLCGPATHPGADTAGASGANAARVILKAARRSPS